MHCKKMGVTVERNRIQSEMQNVPIYIHWERAKEVGSLGGLNTSLERMGMSVPR